MTLTSHHKIFKDYDDLRMESVRLSTFENRWSSSNSFTTKELARSGFYNLRNFRGSCVCIFCSSTFNGYEVKDVKDITSLHKDTCLFMSGVAVGNIPIEYMDTIKRICKHIEKEETYDPKCEQANKSPVEPKFVSCQSRKDSFCDGNIWSGSIMFAEAGFYFCGTSDHVRCFYCGGGLRNLEPTDDPWFLHAQAYPKCQFVLTIKGPKYVSIVQEINKLMTKLADIVSIYLLYSLLYISNQIYIHPSHIFHILTVSLYCRTILQMKIHTLWMKIWKP
ncbi:baculoviral IAP repeat containing protein 2-like [Penaeus vannamei nudivirus]|nr:baculoviral IAP repeat containing protein 2-like [Penaeus vannamei nucleopolyhedrovirus]